MELKYLPTIHSPSDLKKLTYPELDILAEEIRGVLISTVSENGGHLASNLGVVELTIAIHKVFDSPKDSIVWDVGHQSYVHKLLTGRYEDFGTIRTDGGLSGFTRPDESPHDVFLSGHSSTAMSAALGIAQANKLKKNKNYAVAVVGDGAFTGGMVYEAMNNAGRSRTRLITILNNNEMSISPNVGSLARYFAVIRSSPSYFRMKARTENLLNKIPLIGVRLSRGIFHLKTTIKNAIYGSNIFEDFGFRYVGPIDGHNIKQLCTALSGAKSANYPIILHVNTVKGKGYQYAESDPGKFHGISKFNIVTGEPIISAKTYSQEFGDFLRDAAEKDKRICAVTAAMAIGTGLTRFHDDFPDRFYDVGIAEEHAVTFCSGLAKGGMLPVFAVYSTFLQRAYDQIVHDGALQGLKIVLAIDHAGFVGPDGETHHGLLDVPFLNTVPDITVYSPSSFEDLRHCFYRALYKDSGVTAIRYPAGAEVTPPEDFRTTGEFFDLYGEDADTAVVTYGRTFCFAAYAAREIKKEYGRGVLTVRMTRVKPIDEDLIDVLKTKNKILFFEEGEKSGGVGELLLEAITEAGFTGVYRLIAIEDKFVEHAGVGALLARYGLDAASIKQTVLRELGIEGNQT